MSWRYAIKGVKYEQDRCFHCGHYFKIGDIRYRCENKNCSFKEKEFCGNCMKHGNDIMTEKICKWCQIKGNDFSQVGGKRK